MKKFFAITAAILAGSALVAFAGCSGDSIKDALGGGLGGGAGTQAEAGAKNAYALGAVTTANLLAASMPVDAAATASEQSTGSLPTTDVEAFSEYFEMLDTFLDEGLLTTTVTENTDTSYAFSTKLTVEGKILGGDTVSYTMYYTETEARSYEGYEDRDEYTRGVAYQLEGVLEWNGVAYAMSGFRASETEQEGREEETSESLWIKAADPNDPSNYVRMDVESEAEQDGRENESEREFVYRVYREGRLAEQTSISFETENEGQDNETEYEISMLKDGLRSRYEVEREERVNGTTTIGVRYQTPDGNGRFVVTKRADGTYVYQFDDGSRFEDRFEDHFDRFDD